MLQFLVRNIKVLHTLKKYQRKKQEKQNKASSVAVTVIPHVHPDGETVWKDPCDRLIDQAKRLKVRVCWGQRKVPTEYKHSCVCVRVCACVFVCRRGNYRIAQWKSKGSEVTVVGTEAVVGGGLVPLHSVLEPAVDIPSEISIWISLFQILWLSFIILPPCACLPAHWTWFFFYLFSSYAMVVKKKRSCWTLELSPAAPSRPCLLVVKAFLFPLSATWSQ